MEKPLGLFSFVVRKLEDLFIWISSLAGNHRRTRRRRKVDLSITKSGFRYRCEIDEEFAPPDD